MNGKILSTFIAVCFLSLSVSAQYTVMGNFLPLAGQHVRLVGFEGFGVYNIDSTKVSEQGIFRLSYAPRDRGMGYLAAEDDKAYFVVLADENIYIKGEVFSLPESIITVLGKENKLFAQYATEYPKREQALSAWVYLRKIYKEDSLFSIQKLPSQVIKTEMLRLKREDLDFLNNLDAQSYVSWFLPTRKLVSSVSAVVQYRTEEIPNTITAFRNIDFSDKRLYKSGLYKDVIDSHFWLIENMGQSLDTVFKEMSISIDLMLASLSGNDNKFNEITKYLFHLLESRSLHQSSEYLAMKVLSESSCTINDDLAKQLELYRAMKRGNIAPDIVFNEDVFKSGMLIETPKRLSDIQTDYKVVVFGASWCPNCVEELSQLRLLYEKWKLKGFEVVYISLDTDNTVFRSFTSIFPFISICDYRKWNTQAVVDYYVFSTPTIFLLDSNRKILLRPNSVKQVDAWVEYYLGESKE